MCGAFLLLIGFLFLVALIVGRCFDFIIILGWCRVIGVLCVMFLVYSVPLFVWRG